MTHTGVYSRGSVFSALLLALILFASSCAFADQAIEKRLTQAKTAKKMVMLELGSVGCIPCEQMRPVMDKLSTQYKGKLDVIFVDVKKDRETARKFGVYGIPTQVFLDRNGREFHRHVGYYPYEQIVPVLRKVGL